MKTPLGYEIRMSKEKQTLVPFGKYKGKPVERLLQDESYAKWLAGEDWFQEKFQNLYTLIVHNYHSEPVDTPEHNQMQVKFLNPIHAIKTAFIALKKNIFQFDSNHFQKTIPSFLADLKNNNVDVKEIIDQLEKLKGEKLLKISKVEFETKGLDVKYDVSYGYSNLGVTETTYRKASTVFDKFWGNSSNLKMKIELKPFIGDDFPTILRQMKTSGAQILVIREYNGTGASFDEFIQFFHSQGIKVVIEQEIEQTELPVYDEKLEFDEKFLSS